MNLNLEVVWDTSTEIELLPGNEKRRAKVEPQHASREKQFLRVVITLES